MSTIPDTRLLSDMSIPGTHQTMSRDGNIWVWCQSLSLVLQMTIGIRFLDIRCRHYHDGLPIHHGMYYQNTNFTSCIKEMVSFLESNPSEALLIRVKEERDNFLDPSCCSRSFGHSVWAGIQSFPRDKFWLEGYIPTMTQARGKIVLLRDFDIDMTLGILYSHLVIADDWQSTGDNKWKSVHSNLNSALNGPSSEMYLTYNSASANGQAPTQIARVMNTRLHNYVRGHYGRLGIIAIDYPGPRLIEDIISRN